MPEASSIIPIVPVPRCPVVVRVGTPADLPFLDALQGMHRHMVGWLPRQQIEQYVGGGHLPALLAFLAARSPFDTVLIRSERT
jgi:hypothetical protein